MKRRFECLFWTVVCVFVLLCTCETRAQTCMFTKRDLPVPADSVIVGDPRKKAECRRSSFEETRPAKLFDPGGIRMWTREEDTSARSSRPCNKYIVERGMHEDTFVYLTLNMLAPSRNGESESKFAFQVPRNLKAGSSTLERMFDLSKY